MFNEKWLDGQLMLSKYPLVSVLISNAKGTDLLEDCLQSVLKTKYPNFEVVIVDNLTSGIESWIAKNYPNVKVIHSDEDQGYSGMNNYGFKATSEKSEYVAFLNNDARVDPDWISELLSVLKCDETVAAAQPKIYRMDGETFDTAGGFIDYLGYCCSRDHEKDKGQYDIIDEIFFADCAANLVKRKVLKELESRGGIFDEQFFIYKDDIDLFWRIRLRGYRILYVPKAIAYHMRGAASFAVLPEFKVFHLTKNQISMLLKNYDIVNLMRYLPMMVAAELVRNIVLLKTKPPHAIANLKAYLWCFKRLRDILMKRSLVQRVVRRVSDSIVRQTMKPFNPLNLYRLFDRLYY